MDFDPPLQAVYSSLFDRARDKGEAEGAGCVADEDVDIKKLPMIDLGRLLLGDAEREGCKKDIAAAAREWGFFQVRNHGVPKQLLERIYVEQMKVFRQPFNKKKEERLLNFSVDSYRWGAPNATSLQQLSWSEAYHISLSATSAATESHLEEENNSDNLRSVYIYIYDPHIACMLNNFKMYLINITRIMFFICMLINKPVIRCTIWK